jgi:hypothetical protein
MKGCEEAIAHIRGYELDDDRVRTLAVAAIAGDATVKEVVKRIGSDLGTRAGKQASRQGCEADVPAAARRRPRRLRGRRGVGESGTRRPAALKTAG